MKKFFAFLLCVAMCFSCVACSIGWKTQTLIVEGEKVTISMANDKGYYFEYDDGDDDIVFTYDDDEVAIGFWYKTEYYDYYEDMYSSNCSTIEVDDADDGWTVYQSKESADKTQAVATFMVNDKLFFMIFGADVDHLCELVQIINLK